ncbi:YDG/SRA domain-containing protein [Amycolatopsis magusensis]|uniref:Restriction endonuclease n=1 Tax=Amycolatopsis magusensis TaxID=882444 RepID=A0ABS4PJ32_9PSEU|nr:YDG/SRA domain-containing protein [Amycolatopsis magusensis]MBP2179432.1 putative restriction endonuclease [Amycolatopsis magusensis]
MSLADISREDVLKAMAEYDHLGRDKFLSRYGFRTSRRYVVVAGAFEYDSKALLGVAHRFATGEVLKAGDFSGGGATVVARAMALGFEVRDLEESSGGVKLGEIDGVPEGTWFAKRADVAARGVHRNQQWGIVGNQRDGAESIVVSGGYEDDEDYGDVIIYTGHGGRDRKLKKQVADQSFEDSGNAALLTSKIMGTPVRVVRGNTATGYRYDGLFRVEDFSRGPGRSGFKVCRFRMVKIRPEDLVDIEPVAPAGNAKPVRRTTSSQRVVRKTAVADFVKALHDHTCQMCGTRLTIRGRGYSEGAHIRALGRPHDGPDEAENVLCLCPNCHVRFDGGEVLIDSDLSFDLDGEKRQLLRRPGHVVKREHVDYHRARHS